MVTCHLQLKMKSKTEFPFLMYKLIAKIKHLQLLPTLNLLSVDNYTHFDSSKPSTYTIDAIYTLASRCF